MFAARSAALRASGEPMSGFGAPARTAMPTRESMILELPAISPLLTRSPMASSSAMTRSKLTPCLRSAKIWGTPWNLIVTLFPLARSNIGMSAPITTGMGPAVLTTVISPAIAPLAATSAHKQPAVADAAILDHVLMMSSQRCPRMFARPFRHESCLERSAGAPLQGGLHSYPRRRSMASMASRHARKPLAARLDAVCPAPCARERRRRDAHALANRFQASSPAIL